MPNERRVGPLFGRFMDWQTRRHVRKMVAEFGPEATSGAIHYFASVDLRMHTVARAELDRLTGGRHAE